MLECSNSPRGKADVMRTAVAAVITGAVLHAIMTETTVIRRTARPIDRGYGYLCSIMRNADLIHVRGPGEVGEQDEKYQCFGNDLMHGGEFIQIILVTQPVIMALLRH